MGRADASSARRRLNYIAAVLTVFLVFASTAEAVAAGANSRARRLWAAAFRCGANNVTLDHWGASANEYFQVQYMPDNVTTWWAFSPCELAQFRDPRGFVCNRTAPLGNIQRYDSQTECSARYINTTVTPPAYDPVTEILSMSFVNMVATGEFLDMLVFCDPAATRPNLYSATFGRDTVQLRFNSSAACRPVPTTPAPPPMTGTGTAAPVPPGQGTPAPATNRPAGPTPPPTPAPPPFEAPTRGRIATSVIIGIVILCLAVIGVAIILRKWATESRNEVSTDYIGAAER